jgi:ABC-type sugar transport system ATPase subunit
MVSIELKSLHKKFNQQTVLNGIDIRVEAGAKIAIVGPSGSGKSTLLRIIAGLEPTNSGKVYLDEQDATHLSPQHRSIGMLFQQDALYPHLSVEENIHFAKPTGSALAPWMKHFDELVSWMELQPLLKRNPQQLSGGEQQRVALVRALIRRPKILLLDEPLSHLDRRLSRKVQSSILSAQQRYGITMLYVTHDVDEALSFADQLIVLHQGEIVQAGSPSELIEKARPFVRDFLDLDRYCRCIGEYRMTKEETLLELSTVRFAVSTEDATQTFRASAEKSFDMEIPANTVQCRVRLTSWKPVANSL